MRLWHWELISVLPRRQLLGQWRECCLIARNMRELGTPDHILVDPIMEYPLTEFLGYCRIVADEMMSRGYTCDKFRLLNALYGTPNDENIEEWDHVSSKNSFFYGWHNKQYFWQCYYNLEEKHDRGGITKDEWGKIKELVKMHNYA